MIEQINAVVQMGVAALALAVFAFVVVLVVGTWARLK